MSSEASGTETFAKARRRLARAVDSACSRPSQPWADRVAAAIRAALEFAAADPVAAREVFVQAADRGIAPDPEFTAVVDRYAAMLSWGAPLEPRSERAARGAIVLIARQVLLHLERRPEGSVTEIAPDLIVFVLTPYVGLVEARRQAEG